MLTAKQLAEVKGCSFQYIQKKIKEGKLQAVETVNSRNRKVYQIPLESLDEELQQRWYQMQKEQIAEGAVPADQEPEQEQPDRYSEAERKEMDFWIGLIRKWQEYRCMAPSGSKAEVVRNLSPGAAWNTQTGTFPSISFIGSGNLSGRMI